VPPKQAAAAARKYPQLLFTPPGTLVGSLSALQDLLGLTRSKALPLVLQKPGLLLSKPGALARQLHSLQSALKATWPQVVKLATRAPIVLQELSPASTAAKVALLRRELGLKYVSTALQLVCGSPALLDYSVDSMAAKLGHLRALLAAVPTRASDEAAADAAAAAEEEAIAAVAADRVAEAQAAAAGAAGSAAAQPARDSSSSSSSNDSSSGADVASSSSSSSGDLSSSSAEVAGNSSSSGSDSSSSSSSSAGDPPGRDLRSELRRVVLLAPLLLTRSPRDITAKLEAISGMRGIYTRVA
jgi:hypothetical protein